MGSRVGTGADTSQSDEAAMPDDEDVIERERTAPAPARTGPDNRSRGSAQRPSLAHPGQTGRRVRSNESAESRLGTDRTRGADDVVVCDRSLSSSDSREPQAMVGGSAARWPTGSFQDGEWSGRAVRRAGPPPTIAANLVESETEIVVEATTARSSVDNEAQARSRASRSTIASASAVPGRSSISGNDADDGRAPPAGMTPRLARGLAVVQPGIERGPGLRKTRQVRPSVHNAAARRPPRLVVSHGSRGRLRTVLSDPIARRARTPQSSPRAAGPPVPSSIVTPRFVGFDRLL